MPGTYVITITEIVEYSALTESRSCLLLYCFYLRGVAPIFKTELVEMHVEKEAEQND